MDTDQGELVALGVPKHKRLMLEIEDSIRGGRLALGQKLPTEKELMKQYGYSSVTVGRALRALAQAGLVKRSRRTGTFVSFKGGASRSAHRSHATPSAITLMHFHGARADASFHPYFSVLWESLMVEAGAQGCSMKFTAPPQGVLNVDASFPRRHGISGFLAGAVRKVDYEAALEHRIPFVSLSRWYPALVMPRVTADHGQALRMAFAYFRERGHARIAVVDKEHFGDAVEAAAEVFGCLPTEAPVTTIRAQGFDRAAGERILDELRGLAPAIKAVFVCDDILLKHFAEAMRARGLRAPEDLDLAGIGTQHSAAHIGLDVTLAEFDPCETAREAIGLLLKQIREGETEPRTVLVPPRWVVRASTVRA